MMRFLFDLIRRWRARPVVTRIVGVDAGGRWS
jgi:hypothetical protein